MTDEARFARYQRPDRADVSGLSVSGPRAYRVYGSNPIEATGLTVERVRGIRTELVRVEGHRFWPNSLSFLEPKRFDFTQTGPKHLTDLYLLSLTISNRGCLITFDRTIPVQTVTGFQPDEMEVLTGEL